MPSAKSQPSASKKSKERRLSEQTPRKANGERQRFSEGQRKLLEEAFQRNKFIAREEKTLLANRSGVPEKSFQIKDWFYMRRNKDKRRSLHDEVAVVEPVANEASGAGSNQVEPETPGVELGNDQPAPTAMEAEAPPEEGVNEMTAADAQAVMDWISSPMPPQAVYQPPHVAAPEPMPVSQVQATENSLVEASGCAMILRLRQLYEKDTKLFLRAQNDICNAIFEYEDKEL